MTTYTFADDESCNSLPNFFGTKKLSIRSLLVKNKSFFSVYAPAPVPLHQF